MRARTPIAGFLLILLTGGFAGAQSTLFFLEVQAVGAYSTSARKVQLFSLMPEDTMQKPSLGFDLIRRFSGRSRDLGVLAVQARLAFAQEGEHRLEFQLYNAYFRLKTGFSDIWAGHNRPAFGLSSSLDSHALLLPSPAMMGYGFDRDWGVGLQRDFPWGGAAASLTAGSGMPLYLKGNFLAALRVAIGVPSRDNYGLGFSLAHGNILETMGYALLDDAPVPWTAASADLAFFWRNLESRLEVLTGRKAGQSLWLFFWRPGLNLLEEGRLKLEAQPAVWKTGPSWGYSLAGGVTYQITADLAARGMVLYDHARNDARFVVQLYYYRGL